MSYCSCVRESIVNIEGKEKKMSVDYMFCLHVPLQDGDSGPPASSLSTRTVKQRVRRAAPQIGMNCIRGMKSWKASSQKQ